MNDKQVSKNKNICTVGAFGLVFFLLLLLENFVWNISRVDGNSMYPTLHDGDVLLETQLRHPKNGDIVSCTSDMTEIEDGRLVKRIIAMEGDHLIIRNSNVFVNGNQVSEEYIYESSFDGDEDIVIPKGMCYVLGDNRNNSADSRDYGFIRIEDITGVVLDCCIRKGDYRYEDRVNN